MADERRVCACYDPEELPDMTCGKCGLRRVGDDLSSEQLGRLAMMLAPFTRAVPDEPRQLVRRKRGRMVRRNERRV